MDSKRSKALLQEAKAGSVDAFAELFEALRPVLYGVAYRVVGPDDADDAVMETYLKAWRALPRFSERSSLKTWLFRIAHNCALDIIRGRSRRRERILPEDEHDSRGIADLEDKRQATPAELLARNEQAGVIRKAVERLDDRHRETLLLRFADGLSYAEIAAATDVSIGTVMSRLFNARRKLRRLMTED